MSFSNDVCFVTYLTVEPNKEIIDNYLADFNDRLLKGKPNNLAILGPHQININTTNLSKNIMLFKSVQAFEEKLLKASIFA